MSNQIARMRERLIAAGCPVDPIDPELEKGHRELAIRPLSSHETYIFDLSQGGTGYVMDVAITNLRSHPFTVCELSVELPWQDPQFYWLEDPHESVPEVEEYFFSRSLTFPRSTVLNHRVLNYGRIPGYGVITGLLLGRSFTPIPETCPHGTEVRAVMHLFDHADVDHTLIFSLRVDRSASLEWGERSERRFPGLYGPGERRWNKEECDTVNKKEKKIV